VPCAAFVTDIALNLSYAASAQSENVLIVLITSKEIAPLCYAHIHHINLSFTCSFGPEQNGTNSILILKAAGVLLS
jgi:hypothetical protein